MVSQVSNRCIYCEWEGRLSREHYLPRCLGNFRNYELLNDRVCKRCNESFSEIDEQFCRSGPEAIVRALLGVEGRKAHRKISPFQRGSAGADRLVFMAKRLREDSSVEEVELDMDRKSREVRRLRQIIFSSGSQSVAIRITDDMREPGQLLAKMKERGVLMMRPDASDGEVTTAEITGADPEEVEWMRHLLSGLEDNMLGEPEVSLGEPEREAKSVMKANPTEKYFRGLAKIGFHYFLKHMEGFHGSEEAFRAIREFIMNGKAEDVDRFVEGRQSHLVVDIAPGESPTGFRHVLVARASYEKLLCRMQFFIHPKYLSSIYKTNPYTLSIYTVNLGRNPSRIDYPYARSHSFTYSDEHRGAGFDGVTKGEIIWPR